LPLLKRGPEIFPPALFDADGGPGWFVAYTRGRQEKALARHLLPLSIPFYLPLSEKVTRRSGRTFTSYLPLFPGYVFLRGSAAQRIAALRSNLIVRVLEVADQRLLGEELRTLRRFQLAGVNLSPLPTFAPGDPVRVTAGPFSGCLGTVVRDQGQLRLVVSVSILQRSVAVELDRESVAAASTKLELVRGSAVA
jgi:transcriptional antiterminator RfaH